MNSTRSVVCSVFIENNCSCVDTNPLVDSCVQERQRQLKRCRLQENLSDHLVHRPGPLDLVNANILKLDPEVYGKWFFGYHHGIATIRI